MELILFAVTIISLIVAVVMSAAMWRMSRDERVRSNARVAALAAAAVDSDTRARELPVRDVPARELPVRNLTGRDLPVRDASVRSAPPLPSVAKPQAVETATPAATVTPVMIPDEFISESAVGERTARSVVQPAPAAAAAAAAPAQAAAPAAPPWSTTRVSPFAGPKAVAAARTSDLLLRDTPAGEVLVRENTSMGDSFLGGAVASRPTGDRQRGLAIAAAILFVAVAAGGYWTVFGKSDPSNMAAATTQASPLELVSLRHERSGGRLAVTGLVRNPVAGAGIEKLAAVVFLFDQEGGFLTSARANVDFTRLAPGDESPFVINVDAPGKVARYRVSFRNEAGIVPHIDRRGQEPIGSNVSSVR
jgi:hypothetical protein